MPVRLRFTPRKGEVYWCDYPPPECLHLPEFWKRRPVVIVSRHSALRGVATVVPMTSREQHEFTVFGSGSFPHRWKRCLGHLQSRDHCSRQPATARPRQTVGITTGVQRDPGESDRQSGRSLTQERKDTIFCLPAGSCDCRRPPGNWRAKKAASGRLSSVLNDNGQVRNAVVRSSRA